MMVRISYSNFATTLAILSHLEYYWSIYSKTNTAFNERFQNQIETFIQSNELTKLREIKFSRLTKTAKISQDSFTMIESLVTITNTLEQLLIKNNTIKIFSGNPALKAIPLDEY